MDLIIKITDDEAEQLCHSSCSCFYHVQADRFEFTNRDDETNGIMDTFDSSHVMHFCDDNIVNAILWKSYLVAKGFKCVILWDLGQTCYTIVTDQIWNDYMEGNKYVKKDDNKVNGDEVINSESVDEQLEIHI